MTTDRRAAGPAVPAIVGLPSAAVAATAAPQWAAQEEAHPGSARPAGELEAARADVARLAAELERERRERTRLEREHARAERSNAELIRVCVAALHLHGSLEPARVLGALREVMINVLGSEEFALFEPRGPAGEPVATDSFGVEPEVLADAAGRVPAIGRALRGEWFLPLGGEAGAAGEPTACIPLVLEGRVTGALAVFGLLPHRAPLDQADRRLLEMLSGAAPLALHAARLHAAHGAALPDASPAD